jgi:hypothetical protein
MCKTSSTNRTRGYKILILSLAVFLINILAATLWSSRAVAQLPGVTPTVEPIGGCAIDGDLLARTPTTSPFSSSNGDFLENPSAPGTGGGVFTNPGGLPIDPTTAFHIIDGYGNADQNIFTQGSKFNDNPNTWHWTSSSPPGKDDMNHALFHFSTDPEGHTWFMGGADRSAVVGTSYLDFEVLQNSLFKNPDGTFTSAGPDGGRTVGDIVVTVEYSNGGGNASMVAYRWTQTSPGVFSYQVFTPPAGTTFAASNIGGPISVPFGAFGSTTYPQYAYAEAAFDINELIPGVNTCIGARTVLIKTKASDVLNAELKDFIEPVQLELGSIPTVHVNSPTICIGQSTTLSANVTFGVGPFSYIWSPGGQTSSSITVSPTTTTEYSVQVTGLSGCQSHPDTGIVTVNPLPSCSISGTLGPVCPLSSNDYTAPAGMSTYAWTVSGAADIIGATNLQTVTVNARSECNSSFNLVLNITDGNGCSSSCDKTVLVKDVTPPVLTGILPLNVTGVNSCLANAPAGPSDADIAALYTDACGGAITVTHTAVPSGTDCSWSVLYTYTISDKCGNTVIPAPTFTVSGGDVTAPSLTGTLPPNVTGVNSCLANAPAGPSDADIAALYADACGGAITVTHTAVPSGTDCSWSVLYTYSVSDKCGNSVIPAPTFTVSGGDVTAPALTGTLPSDVTGVNSCLANAPAGPSDADIAALYTDACGGAITVTHTAVPSGTDCSWSVLYTYTISDKCGNTVIPAPTFTVSGGDVTAPSLTGTLPPNVTGINSCLANAPAGLSDADIAALYTDACGGGITVVKSGAPTGTDCDWTVTYHYTIADKCGNLATPFDITYSGGDKTAPVLTNLPPSTINGSCGTQPTITWPSATDNCDPAPQVICMTNNCNGPFLTGSTIITFQAVDVCGNTSDPYSVTVNMVSAMSCLIADPAYIPFNHMTGNTLSIDPSINLANIASISWTVSGPGGWLITAGGNGPIVTYTAGTDAGHFTLLLVDIYGCSVSCTKDITVQIADEYCTVTQGYWGNSGGNFCNTGKKLNYINSLLGTTGLLVGCASNTLYFAPGDGQCIINLLPGGGTPARITGTNTCASHPGIQIKNGKINNVLLSQNITLGLNMRIKANLAFLAMDSPVLEVANSSGCMGNDHPIGGTIVNVNFPSSVYTLLQTKYGTSTPTVANLFDLANQALGSCGNIPNNMLSPINDAVTFINEKFDGCKWGTFQGNQSGTNPIILGTDPLTQEDQSAQINLSVMPNPFINSTVIEFSVSKTSRVTLELYNLMGSKIATLFDRNVSGGETLTYTYTADAAMGPGMLICVLHTDYGTKITRMMMTH